MKPPLDRVVTIDYTNWRGERAERRIRPTAISFSSSQWHQEPQWLLSAFDIDKGENRVFALFDIHSWK